MRLIKLPNRKWIIQDDEGNICLQMTFIKEIDDIHAFNVVQDVFSILDTNLDKYFPKESEIRRM